MSRQVSWRSLLEKEDFAGIYQRLSTLVRQFPLTFQVRTSLAIDEEDILQDLALVLERSHRWQHYLAHNFSESGIGADLQKHLSQVLGRKLQKARRETYRLTGEVLKVLRSSTNDFQLLPTRTRKAAHQVYGLRCWPEAKARKDGNLFPELTQNVAPRQSYLVNGKMRTIAREDLEDLLVEIFIAIDSPATVRELRNLVIPKIPLAKFSVYSLETPDREDRKLIEKIVGYDPRDQSSLSSIAADNVRAVVRKCLGKLGPNTDNGRRRMKTRCEILWKAYFDSDSENLTEAADQFGHHRARTSRFKVRFEEELRQAGFTEEEKLLVPGILNEQLLLVIEGSAKMAPVISRSRKSTLKAGERKRAPSKQRKQERKHWLYSFSQQEDSQDSLPIANMGTPIQPMTQQLLGVLLSDQEKKRNATDKLALRCQMLWRLCFDPQRPDYRTIATDLEIAQSNITFLRTKVERKVDDMSIPVDLRLPFLADLAGQLQSMGSQA